MSRKEAAGVQTTVAAAAVAADEDSDEESLRQMLDEGLDEALRPSFTAPADGASSGGAGEGQHAKIMYYRLPLQ